MCIYKDFLKMVIFSMKKFFLKKENFLIWFWCRFWYSWIDEVSQILLLKLLKMAITVIIKDPQWNEVGQFTAEDGKNIAELAAMHGIDIPVSCGAGVCGVCLCKVNEWKDAVKADAFNSPLMPLKTDENWNPEEVLACIGGFNPEKFNDWQDHTVILQRTY